MASEITLAAAFIAGILSFASPCVLPLVPGFLSYLGSAGLSGGGKASRMRVFLNSAAYVLGFTLVFSLLGVLLNGLLGPSAYGFLPWLSRIGGAIIIAFGLYTLGILKLDFLEAEHRLKPSQAAEQSYFFSFLFGASFAVGWSPCVGAILGAVLTLAATAPGQSFALLFIYSLGLGIPFLLAGAFVAQARELVRKFSPYLKYFNMVAGVLLILLGILVFTGDLNAAADFGLAQLALGGK
ncbi:Thiol:disulfide interchange protein DsbD [uncultured archaeon]|nr:Thiol:disulfide interchange protein DsbD [uncultured archaeon]